MATSGIPKDPLSNPRAVPMEVLVLGLCRTGTQSLADALEMLGYKGMYHMREVFKNEHGEFWIAALEAKFEGKGKEFGREQFDLFLGNFTGVSDIPAAIFASELIKAYPDAKVILTTRDEDKWFESMQSTIWHLFNYRKINSPTGTPYNLLYLQDKYVWGGDPEKYGRIRFREHNEHVRQIAPKGRFLEYEVKEGWQPLCEFLGKEVPDVPFPRADDWAEYKKSHKS